MTDPSSEVTVRPEAPADRAAVRALVRAAFGDHTGGHSRAHPVDRSVGRRPTPIDGAPTPGE